MPSDLMTLSLTRRTTTPANIDAVELRGIQTSDRDALATAYLAAYPPGVAATSLNDARQEMDDTFTGEFGALRHDLTRVATFEDRPVGAILVVGKSIWDPQLHGPFIIDLFVHPDVRGMGVGRALLDDAVHACARARYRQGKKSWLDIDIRTLLQALEQALQSQDPPNGSRARW